MSALSAADLAELGLPSDYTPGRASAFGQHLASQPAAPRWNGEDYAEAVTQAVLRGVGCLRGKQLHPLAQAMIEAGRESLPDALQALAAARFGPGAVDHTMPKAAIIKAALGTGDLPVLLGQTAAGISREFRSAQLQDLIAISAQLEATNYKPNSYSLVDLDDLPAPSDQFGKEYTEVRILASGEPFQLLALYCKIGISIQALANDDRGLIRAGVQAFLTAAARNEASLAYGLISNNGNLQDGGPIFHADYGNLVTGAALNTTGLGSAFSALRSQPTGSGLASDAAPAILLVHADDEATARILATSMDRFDARGLKVVATSYLPSAASWYLFASPESFPVLGRVLMRNADPSGVSFGTAEPSASTPGVDLPATHQVGWSVLGRVGAIKANKA